MLSDWRSNNEKRRPVKADAHKEVFAIALMIFSQKCYGVSIDNVTALVYNDY